jgi:hypothetical protein
VLAADGRTLAYVKVGVDPLTQRLVRAEAAALATLADAGLRRLTAPRVLHVGEWNGLTLLVLSPLPVGSRSRPTWQRVLDAQLELAGIGSAAAEPLGTSPYWRALVDRVAALPPSDAAEQLAMLVARATDRFGDVPLRFGAWHGDWTPWNTAGAGDELLVWDWERFAPAVPVGYDALHWGLQTDLVNRLADPSESTAAALASAPVRLRPFGVSAHGAQATAVGYLAELATRYLADRQQEAGARFGEVGAWLLPAIDRALSGASRVPELRGARPHGGTRTE